MKILKIFLASALLIFASALTAQSQNKSDQNSDVMLFHQWYEFGTFIVCDTTSIEFSGNVQQIVKTSPDGSLTNHYNAYGEGYDQDGNFWKWHDAWNAKWDGSHEVRNFTLQGPKGAKLDSRFVFVKNGNGEIVRAYFDPLCD